MVPSPHPGGGVIELACCGCCSLSAFVGLVALLGTLTRSLERMAARLRAHADARDAAERAEMERRRG